MTAQGEDLLAWLETAISVREAAATAAATSYGGRWVQGFPEQHKDPDMRYGWDQDMVHLSQEDPHIAYQCLSDEIAAHTVLNDPESVLRRCAADRKLIAAHPVTRDVIVVMPDGIHGFGCSVCHTEDLLTVGDGWCDTLLALAEGYGWTGGER